VFANISLPDIATVSRRTVIAAVIFGALGLVVCLVLNAVLVGIGLCIGIALGLVNFRMVQASVAKVGQREVENKRRPLALNTLTRLGIITVIALGLLFLNFDLAFGVLAGLAAFQLLLLINVSRSMYKAVGTTGLGLGGLSGAFSVLDDEDDVIDVEAAEGSPPTTGVLEPVPDDPADGA